MDDLQDKVIRLICSGLPGPNKCVAPACECYEKNGKPVYRELMKLLASLSAEPVECPNCVTPWKCNGPHGAAEPVAWMGRSAVDREKRVFATRDEPMSDACGPWQPLVVGFAVSEPNIAGSCTKCGQPVFHRPNQPGEFDHEYAAPPEREGFVSVPREPTDEQEAAGGVVLWEKQFEGTPWRNKVKLIDPDSMNEYNEVARHVYEALLAASQNAQATQERRAGEVVQNIRDAEHKDQSPAEAAHPIKEKGNG